MNKEIQIRASELRKITSGRRVLFIGGQSSMHAEKHRLLEEALDCELIWPNCGELGSVYRFEPEIAKSDITVLLSRWIRHGYTKAEDIAHKHGKLVARLTRGLGVNQVVSQLHAQLVANPHLKG